MKNSVDVTSGALLYQAGFLNSVKPNSKELKNELDEMQKLVKSTAALVAKGDRDFKSAKTDRTERIQKLDAIFKKSMDNDLVLSNVNAALEQVTAFVNQHAGALTMDTFQQEQNYDPAEKVFEKSLKKKLEALNKMGETKKFANFAKSTYHPFRSQIHDIIHEDSDRPMGNIQSYFKDYVQDDDIEIEEEHISYKCPLTKMFYEDPVTSKVCGHSFSKAAIFQILEISGKTLCPIPACAHNISKNDLVADPQLQERTNKAKLQEQKRQNKENDQLKKLE